MLQTESPCPKWGQVTAAYNCRKRPTYDVNAVFLWFNTTSRILLKHKFPQLKKNNGTGNSLLDTCYMPDMVWNTFYALAPLTLSFTHGCALFSSIYRRAGGSSKTWRNFAPNHKHSGLRRKDCNLCLTPKILLLTTLQLTLYSYPSTWRIKARESRNNAVLIIIYPKPYFGVSTSALKLLSFPSTWTTRVFSFIYFS